MWYHKQEGKTIKEETNMAKNHTEKKKHYDVGKIFTKVIAAFIALIMIAATAGTIIYYIVYAV